MRVREGFDHSYFGTGLRPDDDLDAACMEVLNSIERTRWIMLSVANEESVSDRIILRMDILNVRCSNSQRGNGVRAKRESRSGNVASTPIFTVCGVVARTSPARVIASKSSPQIMTRRKIEIFIGAHHLRSQVRESTIIAPWHARVWPRDSSLRSE